MQVNATIRVNGRPLVHAYVEHLVFGVGTNVYMTDRQGKIRSDAWDLGIDSFTNNADIRVMCQNPILRVVDGKLINIAVYQDVSIKDGAVVNLNTTKEQRDHYEILDRVWRTYHTAYVWTDFYQKLDNPNFPLGRSASLKTTMNRPQRIDLSYPDKFDLSPLAFVEPKRLRDNYPLMHIKDRAVSGRLFGESGARPGIIPSELSHALHFSHLSLQQRGKAQDKYLEFIVSEVAAGRPGTHAFSQRTSAIVAFIEALDHYGERFCEFIRARGGHNNPVSPVKVTQAIERDFLDAEWSVLTRPASSPAVSKKFSPAPPAPPADAAERTRRRNASTRTGRTPNVQGGDVEGAVYAAIFVDFARSVGLGRAVSIFLEANALTFGEYRSHVHKKYPECRAELSAVQSYWKL
ncbi:Uncharacterised protein [Kocuria rosea]|uniref:hypothetical protein n=1 Tax=Kocuria rosea TaxID=1275 RepID=UPI000F6FD851|nr:hypothetical protein [Kocuria rosea]VEH41208.1 Uncharacterised protein [Kocuria rosea]